MLLLLHKTLKGSRNIQGFALIRAVLFIFVYYLQFHNLKNRLENGALKALDKAKLCIILSFVLHVSYWGSALNSIRSFQSGCSKNWISEI